MEKEENPRALRSSMKRVFILKTAFTRPVGILLRQQTKSTIKDLEVTKRKPQKGEWETDQAIISQGNLVPFTQDLATERPRVRFGERQNI